MKIKPFIPFSVAVAFVAGAMAAILTTSHCRNPNHPVNPVNPVNPVYYPADTAIARFGIAPVNPDWVQLTHKLTGEQLQAVPSHEWAVFTFAFEPKVEKIEQPNGVAVWKVTFEP